MIGRRESREGNGYETREIRYGARATQSHDGSTTGKSTGQHENVRFFGDADYEIHGR